jgi:hypothetical protein
MMAGRLWQIDPDGTILSDAREYPQPPFDAAVRDAIAAYVEHIGPDLDSIYVTGSVARGLAVPGESDLNMFAVTDFKVDPDLVLRQWTDAAEAQIREHHSCLHDVQLELWPYYYVFNDPARFSIGGFILKTHSLCVWGGDLASGLPDYKVSPAIANDDLVQFEADLEDALLDIAADSSPENLRYWGRRSARAALWSGFGLVQMTESVHTRDLDLCAAIFSQHYPAYAGSIQQALAYARQPTDDVVTLRRFMDSLDWLRALADVWLDQHNPDRDMAMRVDDVEALD